MIVEILLLHGAAPAPVRALATGLLSRYRRWRGRANPSLACVAAAAAPKRHASSAPLAKPVPVSATATPPVSGTLAGRSAPTTTAAATLDATAERVFFFRITVCPAPAMPAPTEPYMIWFGCGDGAILRAPAVAPNT